MGSFFEIEFHDNEEPLSTIYDAFCEAIRRAFELCPGGLVGMEILHPELDHSILIPFSDSQKLTADNAINVLQAVLQSASGVVMGRQMQVKVVMVNPPTATGKGYIKGVRLLGENAPCITQIKNKDKLCVARAIVYEMARKRQRDSRKAYNYWCRIKKQDGNPAMRRAAVELMEEAGIEEGTECGIPELKLLQAIIPFQLKAWTLDLELFFEGDQNDKQIFLLFVDKHCNVIRSITRFLNRSYYCHSCNKGYNNSIEHRKCKGRCTYCFTTGTACPFEGWIKCEDCGRFFPSNSCSNNHKQSASNQKPICEQLRVCQDCHKYTYSNREHHCGKMKCGTCKQWDDPDHHQYRCYMPAIQDEDEADHDHIGFIMFDLETTQETQISEDSRRHIPNYCVVQKVCDTCKDEWTPHFKCGNCKEAQRTFAGANCLTEFAEWLFVPDHQGRTVFAHNFKAFDGQFILEYALKRGLKPSTIMRGLSILSMEIEKIRFLDSFCFIPMPLSALPSAFGFEQEVTKGFFPHFYNTAENQDYVGEYPALVHYGADQ